MHSITLSRPDESEAVAFLQTKLRAREQVNELEKVFYHLVSLIKQDIRNFPVFDFLRSHL